MGTSINKDKGYDEENPEDKLVEEITEDISEEEDIYKDSHEGFLIADDSDSNDIDRDTEVEYLISAT